MSKEDKLEMATRELERLRTDNTLLRHKLERYQATEELLKHGVMRIFNWMHRASRLKLAAIVLGGVATLFAFDVTHLSTFLVFLDEAFVGVPTTFAAFELLWRYQKRRRQPPKIK